MGGEATRAAGERLLSIALALASGTVLAIARWLEPAAAGHGTHTELGFAPCGVLVATGWPCPMCGMTTSFTLLARGDVLGAGVAQPFGVVLFLVTAGLFVVALAEGIRPAGRWSRLDRHLSPRAGWIVLLGGIGILVGWSWKIAMLAPGGALIP